MNFNILKVIKIRLNSKYQKPTILLITMTICLNLLSCSKTSDKTNQEFSLKPTTSSKSKIPTNVVSTKFEIKELPTDITSKEVIVLSPYSQVKSDSDHVLAISTSKATSVILGLDKKQEVRLLDFIVPDLNPTITLSNESTARALIFANPIFWSLNIESRKKIFQAIPTDSGYLKLVNLIKEGKPLSNLTTLAHDSALRIYKKVATEQQKPALEQPTDSSSLQPNILNYIATKCISPVEAAISSKIIGVDWLKNDTSMLLVERSDDKVAALNIVNNGPLAYRYIIAAEGSISPIVTTPETLPTGGWFQFSKLPDQQYAEAGYGKSFFIEDRDFSGLCMPIICIPSPANPNPKKTYVNILKSTPGRQTFSIYFSAFANKGKCSLEDSGAENALCRNYINLMFDISNVFLGKQNVIPDNNKKLIEDALGMIDLFSKLFANGRSDAKTEEEKNIQFNTAMLEIIKYIISKAELPGVQNSYQKNLLDTFKYIIRVEELGAISSRLGNASIALFREAANNFPQGKLTVQGITVARSWKDFKEELRSGDSFFDEIENEYILPEEFELGRVYLNRKNNLLNAYILKQGESYPPGNFPIEIIEEDAETLVKDGKAVKFTWKQAGGVSLLADSDGFYYIEQESQGCLGKTCLTAPAIDKTKDGLNIKNILMSKKPIPIKPFHPPDILGEWRLSSQSTGNIAFRPTILFFPDGAVEIRIQNGFASACGGKYRFTGPNTVEINYTGMCNQSSGKYKIRGSKQRIRVINYLGFQVYDKVTDKVKRNCFSKGVCF